MINLLVPNHSFYSRQEQIEQNEFVSLQMFGHNAATVAVLGGLRLEIQEIYEKLILV